MVTVPKQLTSLCLIGVLLATAGCQFDRLSRGVSRLPTFSRLSSATNDRSIASNEPKSKQASAATTREARETHQARWVSYQDTQDSPSDMDTRTVDPRTPLSQLSQSDGLDNLSPQPVVGTPSYPRPNADLKELPDSFEMMTLDEAIAVALYDTKILRSLSADIVRNPNGAGSAFDAAIQATDANFGVNAALAQFDATMNASALYANNDDYFNNPSTTGNATEVQQDLTTINLGWNKVNQQGTQFSINNALIHDNNSNPTVLFPSSWEHRWEATARHPLMQGGGTLFNQVAGPNSRPGFLGTSGWLVSRTNLEVSKGDFQRGLRDLVLEIINAYWQLDLAYRNYETIKSARDASHDTWQAVKAKFDQGLVGGEADREAQARAQFYQFELQLDRALNSTTDANVPGVLQAEANLRRLLNLPQSGGELIRPSDRPTDVASIIDWDQLAMQATSRRIEIQQQQQRIRRSELELIAAKNFTMPRLDALATYRNSGLGNDLINDGGKFAGALNEAWSGNYDEWEFGFAFDMPIGFRQARSGVRNASLKMARERALLNELKQQILHEVGSAFRSVRQSSASIRLATLQRDAARDTLKARQAAYEADTVGFEDLLDAQQRYLEASLALHNVKTDRELALSRLYSESGSLLSEFRISTE